MQGDVKSKKMTELEKEAIDVYQQIQKIYDSSCLLLAMSNFALHTITF